MRPTTIVPVDMLNTEPYSAVVCYPKAPAAEIEERIKQLLSLGVSALEFSGKASAFNLPILGKGYVGIVVVAHVGSERLALKMRRMDADRIDLYHEAEMLQKANAVSVGPRFIAVRQNFLLMQLVDGSLLTSWLECHRDKETVRMVLADVLEQCYRLDEAGLDHGELSKATKHILVDNADKPFIVDFETASLNRHPANITAVCQYVFQSNFDAAHYIAEVLGQKGREKLIAALRNYKKNMSRQSFEELRQFCLFEQ